MSKARASTQGESSAPWGSAAAFAFGIVVLVLGAGNSASFLALLPGLGIMSVGGGVGVPRGVLASHGAPNVIVTWTLGLLLVGAIPKRSGEGALRLQWWLEEFVATGTEVVETGVVLVQNAEGAALLACVGDVIRLDSA